MKGNGTWALPSGLAVSRSNIALMLSRVPPADRRFIGQSKNIDLRNSFRESVARLASKVYSRAFEALQARGGKTVDLDWWHLKKGSYREQFAKAWDFYEQGFMPRKVMDCALWLCKNGQMYQTRFPRPSQVFGNYVLAALLSGNWEDGDQNPALVTEGCDVPIPLSRAHLGPGAAAKMEKARKSSWIWEPGLVFDPDTGLYTTREKAGPGALDLEDVS